MDLSGDRVGIGLACMHIPFFHLFIHVWSSCSLPGPEESDETPQPLSLYPVPSTPILSPPLSEGSNVALAHRSFQGRNSSWG